MTKCYTMYIDESGIASLTDLSKDKIILAGVIIDKKESENWSSYFNFIKRKYHISETKPFHSHAIFERNLSTSVRENRELRDTCKSLAEFLDVSPATIIVTYIKKDELKKFLGFNKRNIFHYFNYRQKKPRHDRKANDIDIAYEILASRLFLFFGSFLNKNKSFGNIIAESREMSDAVLLKTYNFCRTPNRYNLLSTNKQATFFKNYVSSICFESKQGLRGGLEVADLVSYTTSFYLRRRNHNDNIVWEKKGLNIIWNSLRHDNNIENNKPQKIGVIGHYHYRFSNLLVKGRSDEISNNIAQDANLRRKHKRQRLGTS